MGWVVWGEVGGVWWGGVGWGGYWAATHTAVAYRQSSASDRTCRAAHLKGKPPIGFQGNIWIVHCGRGRPSVCPCCFHGCIQKCSRDTESQNSIRPLFGRIFPKYQKSSKMRSCCENYRSTFVLFGEERSRWPLAKRQMHFYETFGLWLQEEEKQIDICCPPTN